jgi:hypothetical protein
MILSAFLRPFGAADRGKSFRQAAAAVAGAVMLTLAGLPSLAFEVPALSEQEKRELKTAFDTLVGKRKGPFAKNNCVCTDGREEPVLRPDGQIINVCGEKTLFCTAFKAPWAEDLAKHDVYVGTFFSRDLYFWGKVEDHHDLIRGFVLEKFFTDTNPRHRLATARTLKGVSGSEYEGPAAVEFYTRYLSLPDFVDFRHFILAYELQKRYFARGDFGKMQEVRNMATRIEDRDEKFRPLRDAVHNQVSASLIPRLSAYRDKMSAGQTRDMLDELISEIGQLTSLGEEAIEPQLAEIENQALRETLQAYLAGAKDDPIEAVEALGDMMAASRSAVAEKAVSPADAVRLVDLNVMSAVVLQSRGSRLLDSGELQTVEQHLRLMEALTDASYGVGLLSARERDAASANLVQALDSPTIERTELLRRLAIAERSVEWAQTGAFLAFSEVWAQWVYLMPEVAGIIDDVLRGSPLLLFAQVDQRLDEFVKGEAGVSHDIFGETRTRGFRALNPGLAVGPLLIDPETGTYSRGDVLGLTSTPHDLQPAAGIFTLGEGNVVSHVQLLARSLGIPNTVVALAEAEPFSQRVDKDLFYVVTPGDRIVVKEANAMTDQDRAIVEDYTRNHARASDGALDQADGKLHIDKERLDLSLTLPTDLADVGRKDSGVQVGPKAAFLGELKRMFPDKVARGLVVPFGVYYEHYKNAEVALPAEFEGQTIAEPGEPLPQFVERTYEEFFGKMIPGGAGEKELSDWIAPRLAVIRQSIQERPLDQQVEDAIRHQLDALGLLLADDKTQTVGCFVRSDTNVEDLESFNGAGLNLTIFNLRSLEDIYEGIKEVWASPFSYRSFSWRQTLIDEPLWVLPSIIVLESIASEKSGVVITADVNSGAPDKILVATSEGVGGAVDGTPAETLLWSKDGVELLAMFKSPFRQILKPDGGVEVVRSTGSERVLSDEELDKLVKTTLAIEQGLEPSLDANGRPRPWDIEFGFTDGKLWLFQSRPFVGSDEVANLSALAVLDEGTGKIEGSVALTDVVQ